MTHFVYSHTALPRKLLFGARLWILALESRNAPRLNP